MSDFDWAPDAMCPKGCNLAGESSLRRVSSCLKMGKDTAIASTQCVVCNWHWAWHFNPDVPFEHQQISLRAQEGK